MPSISPALPRTLALIACTLLFAGIWSNDQPASAMAMKTGPVPRGIASHEPEWVPVATPMTIVTVDASPSAPAISASRLNVSVGSASKSFQVESEGLLIADEILQSHLNQLPLGLSAGDYRIVDSLGGVGWLHVRTEGEVGSGNTKLPRLLTTIVDEGEVRFIPVKGTVIGNRPQPAIR